MSSQVADPCQAQRLRLLAPHGDGVGVVEAEGAQQAQAIALELLVHGLARGIVAELQYCLAEGAGVLHVQVNFPGREGVKGNQRAAQAKTALHGKALRFQQLRGNLGEQVGFVAVFAGDAEGLGGMARRRAEQQRESPTPPAPRFHSCWFTSCST